MVWSFASNSIPSFGLKKEKIKSVQDCSECSDDDATSSASGEDGLECPLCWESFNIVENVPYVLWCGHTLCKNCVSGLQCATLKFHSQEFKVLFLIFCPWCHLISLRLDHRGNLKFPSKNFFLLWMVESINGDRAKLCSPSRDNQPTWSAKGSSGVADQASSSLRRLSSARIPEQPRTLTGSSSIDERHHFSFYKSLDVFIHFISKFPLVIVFLVIVFFIIPSCGIILAIFFILTALFAIPSFLILYFAYPALEWLVREIVS